MNGMDDNEDETDLFEDDEFDNLSETALQELEHNAILSTQAQIQRSVPKPQPVQQQPPAIAPQSRIIAAQANPNPRLLVTNPAFQRYLNEEDDSFELIGEEGVPTPVEEYAPLHRSRPGEISQRELFRQQRYGQAHRPVGQSHSNLTSHTEGEGTFYGLLARSDTMDVDAPVPPELDGNRDAFQQRLQELMRERDELTRQLRAAVDTASLQKGEISIIRANLEKETRIFDRQIGALKKSMEEESAKHSAQVAALNEKNNSLMTRYKFLQEEHNQEVQESKSLRQRLRDRPLADSAASPATTPRRGAASSLRDGFNDDDIMLVSPSKSARRSKPPTPTAANKRKRKAGEPSPVKPLVLRPSNPSDHAMPPPAPPQQVPQVVEQVVPIIRTDKQSQRHLKFLQSILEYRTKETRRPLIEVFVGFAFPSSPAKTFAAILLEGTAQLQGSRLPGDLLQLFIDLWGKCMKEEYYAPVALLIEVAAHVVEIEISVIDAPAISSIVPALQSSIAVNAEKRFKHSPVSHATYGKIQQTPQSVLNKQVNGTACMELLLTIAYTVSDDDELLRLLWRLLSPEIVLMMLNAWQPISDITLMLRLLSTSTFPTTFGSICIDNQQTKVEHWTVSRVCALLWETPGVDEGLPPYDRRQLCQLRIEVMNLLVSIAITSSAPPHDDPNHHGSLLLAKDSHAIARLVRSLYDEVSAMYALRSGTEKLHAELVNKGVYLLHHLLQLHGNVINLQQKLLVLNGAVYKHRVVLTRLAFSEGFFIDRWITDETVAMATQMLEETATPDEADELIECFPGFKGRGERESE
jgi:hypothetical protein